ncbi:hypothetical protein B6I21_02265 [candidate division KSB1 bacterium 4572_119]|nr:MAG: hypothetical protein B6I21_02265 [candidate division KSB1 bacterium 4572_119]
MHDHRMKKSKYYQDVKARRKRLNALIIFLILLFGAFLVYLLFFYNPLEYKKEKLMISAGICGCVNQRAVYHLPVNSILADLIREAKGVNRRADMTRVNLAKPLMNDSVYHVPCKSKAASVSMPKMSYQPLQPKTIQNKKADHINIFYGGLPHTFMLLQIYPELDLITVTHLPFYTSFSMEKQRLADFFFLMGVDPTVYMVQNFFREKIDFYFVQHRQSFIDMVDYMGGIPVYVDTLFAKEYKMMEGVRRLSGFHSWEFIRFIDKETRKTNLLLGSHLRMDRQKLFMMSMYKFFRSMNIAAQANNVRHVLSISQTNLSVENASSLIEMGIKMKNPKLELLTLPGNPIYVNNVLYWEPRLDTYIRKRSELIQSYGG